MRPGDFLVNDEIKAGWGEARTPPFLAGGAVGFVPRPALWACSMISRGRGSLKGYEL